MVDAVVSFAVQRLGDFLIQEAVFLRGVRDEVEWLKTELRWMHSFLKDAEEKQESDERIGMWISEIRDVAYDIEDVIDTFTLKVKVEGTPKRGFLASVKKCSCIFNKEIDLYNIGKDIEALKKRVVQISSRREAYGIRNISDVAEGTSTGATEKLRQLRRTTSYADEERVVGFEDVVASLVNELLKKERRRCVISILGMGGLGKTTLARKLYHHSQVEGRFRLRTWVCVSQEYRIRDLLQRIIRSFKPFSKEELEMMEKMTEEDLEHHLRKLLKGHSYLVVVDDVWDEEAWKSLRRAFPDNSNGSRVIVTTRIKAVAERSDERTFVHELRFLRSDEGWELFCKKAFPNHINASGGHTSCCPPDLEVLGREMVSKCGGLPLAIIVLGGLLSRKQPYEWHTVKKHIWRDLRADSIHILQILALSFNDLPYQMKPCFLYLGLFPEDFEIGAEKLIRLWVAEGFIPTGDQETLEEVAEHWLNELIGRSLIQAVERTWQRITTCRIHDLLRDLAVKKAKELNFLHIYDGNFNSSSASCTTSSYRRQAAHSSIERYISDDYSNPCLRTLLFFNLDRDEPSSIQRLRFIHIGFKLLRVLDLQSIQFALYSTLEGKRRLPEALGELIHLRYLGLRATRINELPSSIVNLQFLQTLDAFSFNTNIFTKNNMPRATTMRLPGDIRKLKQLRHLIGTFEGLLGVDHLTNLQTLISIDICDWIKVNPVNLINLRRLRIDSNQKEVKEFSLDTIANLRNLESLFVTLHPQMYIISIQPLSYCYHLLQLGIDGKIEIDVLEQMHEYLPNLTHLQLTRSQFSQDPMPALEKLPNLMVLEFYSIDCIDSKKLICTAKGFPRLEVLVLDDLQWLEELEVGEGAMSTLKVLRIHLCDKLMVPERLNSLQGTKNLSWNWYSTI